MLLATLYMLLPLLLQYAAHAKSITTGAVHAERNSVMNGAAGGQDRCED